MSVAHTVVNAISSFESARANMIRGQVTPIAITDRALIAALAQVPREQFVPSHMVPFAYAEKDILLKAATQTSPARYLMAVGPFARLVQVAAIDRQAVVLDVGCATGYSAAVLARLSRSVIALESDEELAALAATSLTSMNIDNVAVVTAVLGDGWPRAAPYDAIVIEGSVAMLPTAVMDQLYVGGRLAAVIGSGLSAFTTIYTKTDSGIGSRRVFNAAVPALPGFAMPKEFVFSCSKPLSSTSTRWVTPRHSRNRIVPARSVDPTD
jgi:protein-L-isoaspartate(D-aspartate) O-methyltransferase